MRTDTNHITNTSGGFTLIEVIISITVSAILAVVLVQFFSVHTDRSWRPIKNLDQGLALQGAMDQITSDYRYLLISADHPLITLQQNVDSGSGNYWDETDNIVPETHCIEFVQTNASPAEWNEVETNATCVHTEDPDNIDDTLLKVTLTYEDQTLTAIFSR